MSTLDALPPRIQAKIRVDEAGCWIWAAAVTARGYGALKIAGIRTARAHRAIYILMRGPIADDLVCDHLCRVKACVNPDHIEVVTQLVNVRRGDRATLVGKTHCALGHDLTGDNLRIRRRAEGKVRRDCRECVRQSDLRAKARKQAAA